MQPDPVLNCVVVIRTYSVCAHATHSRARGLTLYRTTPVMDAGLLSRDRSSNTTRIPLIPFGDILYRVALPLGGSPPACHPTSLPPPHKTPPPTLPAANTTAALPRLSPVQQHGTALVWTCAFLSRQDSSLLDALRRRVAAWQNGRF